MAQAKTERRGLGRGLSALMADVDKPQSQNSSGVRRAEQTVPVEQIVPNPDQPRRTFSESALDELSASIREKGIIQPLILRINPRDKATYEIVAGERRWRAAQKAQLHEVPAVIRDLDDTEVLELAIIENIQRADLNAVEEALGFQQLIDRFGHTQEKLAVALGKSRSHIANLLRILTLPRDVQDLVQVGKLSAGHARALVTMDDPIGMAQRIVREGLSVRQVEQAAKNLRTNKSSKSSKSTTKDADTRQLEKDLGAALGLKVSIDHAEGKESGTMTISYGDLSQLDEVCRRLSATYDAGKV